jgi:hypothetical protein
MWEAAHSSVGGTRGTEPRGLGVGLQGIEPCWWARGDTRVGCLARSVD